MALNEILNKIAEDANHRREEILAEAKRQADEIRQQSDAAIGDLRQRERVELDRSLKENERRVTAAAEQEAKLEIERTKRELLERAFSQVLDGIEALASNDYEQWLSGIAKRLPDEATGDIEAPRARLEETKRVLRAVGLKPHDLQGGDIRAGFVVIGREFDFDLSADELIAGARRRTEVSVAEQLFGDKE